MKEIRPFQKSDIESIYPIYVYYVKNSTALFDLKPMDFKSFESVVLEVAKKYPFYVAIAQKEIIGYAYVHETFSKEAYRYCVELTIYFKQGNHHGLAKPLLEKVEQGCLEKNIRWIIACITDSNKESIAFHKTNGYMYRGSLPECGLKNDAWHGVVWLCKDLSRLDDKLFVAHNATVIGDVSLGKNASVWYGAIIRGDSASIKIGDETNIQDHCTLHVDVDFPLNIGKRVTIGHNAIVHGAEIEDEVLVGMGAIIMNGAHIGSHSIIGAGAVVTENKSIPSGSVVVGSPAKIIKEVNANQIKMIQANAQHYVDAAKKQL